MSIRYTNAVWKTSFDNSGLKLVALALADMANEAGECWPSISTLAGRCGLDARSVRRHIKTLRTAGFMAIRERFLANRQRSNIYQLRLTFMSGGGGRACHPESPIDPSLSEESEETSFGKDAVSVSATWKPDKRTKEEKLASLKPPAQYPSEREFDHYIESNELDGVITYRPDLYADLCIHKWHQWQENLGKWIKIRDWRKFTAKLNDRIMDTHPGN